MCVYIYIEREREDITNLLKLCVFYVLGEFFNVHFHDFLIEWNFSSVVSDDIYIFSAKRITFLIFRWNQGYIITYGKSLQISPYF